jgi:hypothetical protein
MSKFRYKTKVTDAGNVHRYKYWVENFKDQDTDQLIPVTRHRLIKVNGRKVEWVAGMTRDDKRAVPYTELK